MKKKITTAGCTLREVVEAIERVAPPGLAEEWDNVGLLLAPTRARRVRRVLLTIDCTSAVVREAVRRRMDLVLSYHPPLFAPLRRLTPQEPTSAKLIRLLEAGIAVYAPHTALDAAPGGVNDWLAKGIAADESATILPLTEGPGRKICFRDGVPLETMLKRVRTFLGAPYLRIAYAAGACRTIHTVALCAGAGVEALRSTTADVWVTGEMKHHDLLAATARGITVVLSEHTHTERGYLPELRRRLLGALPDSRSMAVEIAREDGDPVVLFNA